MKKKVNKEKFLALILTLMMMFSIIGCSSDTATDDNTASSTTIETTAQDNAVDASASGGTTQDNSQSQTLTGGAGIGLADIPAYNGSIYTPINNNLPFFSEADLTTEPFENYSPLDSLGRCGVASSCLGLETMPTEERGSIGQVKPSGWRTIRYDSVEGKYLYNRSHLIGFQLSAENANERNLITGTRYFNVEGMLPFENMVADYIKETGNHVMYRVTPMFDGSDLVATGVLMEAYSVEDSGAGICYCVFVYNIQPGITINYADGSSYANDGSEPISQTSNANSGYVGGSSSSASQSANQNVSGDYILNENTKKFHYPSCHSVDQMKNPVAYAGSRDDLINQGYEPCKNCNP